MEIKNRITKNFTFNSDDGFNTLDYYFLDKNEYIEKINSIENDFREKKFDSVALGIRKLLEKTLKSFIEYFQLEDINGTWQLDTLIGCIRNHLSIDKIYLQSFYTVKEITNRACHDSILDLQYFEILSLLKSFHIVLAFLFKQVESNSFIKISFNDQLYNISFSKTDHQIITEQKYKEFADTNPEIQKDIVIKDVSIQQLLFDKRIFNIPIYQRKYTWETKNIDDLFEDIIYRMNDKTSHYFGVIAGKIMKQHPDEQDDVRIIKVIDGQQRLTTSLLVVMGCYYRLLELKEEKLIDVEFNYIFSCLGKDRSFIELFVNPGGSEIENQSFEKILSKTWKRNEKRSTNYEINLNHIMDRLEDEFDNDSNKILDFMNTFLNKFILGLVDFNTIRNENKKELEIFENMNSKGRQLELHELIKNHLFNLCSNQVITKNEAELVKEYNRIFGESEDKEVYDFFCELIYFLKGTEIKGKGNSKEEYKSFKNEALPKLLELAKIDSNNNLDLNNFKILMSSIQGFYKNCYQTIKSNKNTNFKQNAYISQILSLNKGNSNKASALFLGLLFLLNSKNINFINCDKNSDLKPIFNIFLHTYKVFIINNSLKTTSDSKAKKKYFEILNKILNNHKITEFDDIQKQIVSEFKISDISSDDKNSFDEFKNSIINTVNKNYNSAKNLLIAISYMLNNNKPNSIIDTEITLEHVLPQNPVYWIDDIKAWNNLADSLTPNEIKEQSKKYIDSIGNMCFLDQKTNSSAQDDKFIAKKECYDRVNYKHITYSNQNNLIDISRKDKWTFKDIENREEYLIKLLYEEYLKLY